MKTKNTATKMKVQKAKNTLKKGSIPIAPQIKITLALKQTQIQIAKITPPEKKARYIFCFWKR